MLGKWEAAVEQHWHSSPEKNPDRSAMLASLARLGDAGLLERFVGGVVTRRFDGSETGALCAAVAAGLEPQVAGKLLGTLATAKTREVPGAVAGLLGSLRHEVGEAPDARWKKALQEIAAAVVAALPGLKPVPQAIADDGTGSAASRLLQRIAWIKRESGANEDDDTDEEEDKARSVRASGTADAAFVMELLTSLRALGADALHARAVAAIAADSAAFDPVAVVVPALTGLRPTWETGGSPAVDLTRLWQQAAGFLLARSEQPPEPPARLGAADHAGLPRRG